MDLFTEPASIVMIAIFIILLFSLGVFIFIKSILAMGKKGDRKKNINGTAGITAGVLSMLISVGMVLLSILIAIVYGILIIISGIADALSNINCGIGAM